MFWWKSWREFAREKSQAGLIQALPSARDLDQDSWEVELNVEVVVVVEKVVINL
jgi:hypothetical protein